LIGSSKQFIAVGVPPGAVVTWAVIGGCGSISQTGLFFATASIAAGQSCIVVAVAAGLSATSSVTVAAPGPTPTPPGQGATVKATVTTARANENVLVQWTDPSPLEGNFITLVAVGTEHYDWLWRIPRQSAGDTQLILDSSLKPGVYQLRMYTSDRRLVAIGNYITII
jgi:hypothetical protein